MTDMGTEQPKHRLPLRIYYEDTDSGGIVYYANYLKFAERARTEMLRECSFESRAWGERLGLAFVVQRCVAEYHQPAKLDDKIEVQTFVDQVGAASALLRQNVYRDDTLLVSMEVRLAMIDRRMKPARLPEMLIEALSPQYKVGN
jgi:acyl-CoA thioester hydrolase